MISRVQKRLLLGIGTGLLAPWHLFLARFGLIELHQLSHRLWMAGMVVTVLTLLIAACVLVFPKIDRILKFRIDFASSHLVFEFGSIALFYVALPFHSLYPYRITLALLFTILGRLIFFHRPFDFFFFFLGAAIGPTMELILTNLNFYIFTGPNFLGIPLWLPLFWGNVALVLRRLSWAVMNKKKKQENL